MTPLATTVLDRYAFSSPGAALQRRLHLHLSVARIGQTRLLAGPRVGPTVSGLRAAMSVAALCGARKLTQMTRPLRDGRADRIETAMRCRRPSVKSRYWPLLSSASPSACQRTRSTGALWVSRSRTIVETKLSPCVRGYLFGREHAGGIAGQLVDNVDIGRPRF